MSFPSATKSLVKSMGSKEDWVPVYSMIDHSDFKPCCLVQSRMKTSWWQSCPYRKTGYKLQDMLLPGSYTENPDLLHDSELFTLEDCIDGTLKGDIGTDDLTMVEVTGAASMSYKRSVKVKKRAVLLSHLDSLIQQGKIVKDHPFIKQSRKRQRNLYVIIASAEVVEETMFGDTNKVESSILYKPFIKLIGSRNRKKTVTIPKGCILAFQAKKLFIREETLGISYYPGDKTTTFRDLRYKCSTDDEGKLRNDCSADYEAAEEDKKTLRMEVKKEYAPLSLLSSNLRGKFLAGFVALMKENDLLEELENQLEQVLEDPEQFILKTDRPELKDLVENLQDVRGAIFAQLAEPVLYFLNALNELTEIQMQLLVESVEKNIISQQLTLVGSILNKAFLGEQNFMAEDQLLTEEEWGITGPIIEEIPGISIQQDRHTVAGSTERNTLSAIAALFVTLYPIDLLSNRST